MAEGSSPSKTTKHSKEQEEIRELREKLGRAERRNVELSEQLKMHKLHTKQLLLGWELKVKTSNDIITTQAREKDHQLTEITSDLLYFESCLLKHRTKAKEKLSEKSRKIIDLQRKVKHQEKQINALNNANERLLASLHELRENYEDRKLETFSGYDSEETLCDNDHLDGVQFVNGSSYNGDISGRLRERERESSRNVSFGSLSANQSANPRFRNGGSRTRKFSDVNVCSHLGNPYEMKTNGIALPRSQQQISHRVRFTPDVKEISEEDREKPSDIVKPVLKIRKISLPAYRLPITDDEKEEYI